MVATVYVTEFATYGSFKLGAEDDGLHSTSQVPGKIVARKELDASTAKNHVFHKDTTIVKVVAEGGPVWLNFDASGSLAEHNRDYIPEDYPEYQGVWNIADNEQRYTMLNVLDQT